MTINYKPQPGRALVINGPQGSGKTKMAEQIASQRGKFLHIEFGCSFKSSLSAALLDEPCTLIIDGDPSNVELQDIKCIVVSQRLQLRPPFSDKKVSVPAPLIFICAQNTRNWLPKDNRRFDVINLL